MPAYTTGANAYAIQSFSFGSTGEILNTTGTITGDFPGPVEYGRDALAGRIFCPPDLQDWVARQGEQDVPAAGGALNLDASGGTATAGGGTVGLSFTYAPGSGTATAGGGTAAFSETLSAAAGGATAGGGVASLSFTYSASGGSATAGGGTVALSEGLTAAAGTASAGGGVVSLAFTYSAAGGGATAGGGDASVTVGGAFSGSASGGTASAGGGAVGLAFSYAVSGGGASASGGSVTLDVVPTVVAPPVETGPTGGGRYEPGGDETSIYGRSVRIVSKRGHAVARGSRATVSTRSKRPLRVLVPPRRERVSVTVSSARGDVVAVGSAASVHTNCTASSQRGTAVTDGSGARVLASSARRDDDGDLAALALLGVL